MTLAKWNKLKKVCRFFFGMFISRVRNCSADVTSRTTWTILSTLVTFWTPTFGWKGSCETTSVSRLVGKFISSSVNSFCQKNGSYDFSGVLHKHWHNNFFLKNFHFEKKPKNSSEIGFFGFCQRFNSIMYLFLS